MTEELKVVEMDVFELLDHPARRRWWLLNKAIECVPLDRALALVGEAEQLLFSGTNGGTNALAVEAEVLRREAPSKPVEVAAGPGTPDRPVPPRMSLSPDQKEQMRRRIAGGATNAELAAEFAITPKQAQGLRMGMARVAKRDHAESVPPSAEGWITSSSVSEIVRYLRQQDDVVVPAGPSAFLVNSRFQLSLTELVERANRMRSRQKKPPFALGEVATYAPRINGHQMVS